ncbi:MAG: TlyA family RNA methyltransferase [Mariprofundales bacterium]|nr:TlyA family RNA methyltransferase [Mariprofundales bacterium]
MAKQRLDTLLDFRGLAENIDQAKRIIMAGLVYVDGQKRDKSGAMFPMDATIVVRQTAPFVSRGGVKLAHALDYFALNPAGDACLDVGASTGGFTDCLLQRGAKHVVALDVGRGQLDYRLRNDDRVSCIERTHIRALTTAMLPTPVTVLVMDVSFITLGRVLPPAAWPHLAVGGWCVVLLKPQFEVEAKHLRGGVVRDDAIRQRVVDDGCALVATLPGAELLGVTPSPIRGPKGNIEFLIAARRKSA